MQRFGALALVVFFLVSPHVARAEGVADPREAADALMRGLLSSDADAIAALYTPNAIYLAPGSPAITGRTAIRDVYARHLAGGRSTIRFFDVRIDRAGSRALVVWRWTSTITPETGAPMRMDGRSMVYMVKGDTGWLISADMLQTLPKF